MAVKKNVLTVSEITRQIKYALEGNFPHVWVQGEISNCKHHTSGHLYFTLKDEGAQISGVMWRSRVPLLPFTPADGIKVIAHGSITVYPPRGNYQIDVEHMQPLGVGELQIVFERLKQKLSAEGLFDEEYKKPIPEYPERIGVVTSETGAALQDIRSILARRHPSVELILYPVKVQGEGAAQEIANAIDDFNRLGNVDVLIVGRGGGSLEDLWAFNEEIVARAIFASAIPIISAVGHEIDFSIADFVADLRAPTPSVAAELSVKHRVDIIENLANLCYTMQEAVQKTIDTAKTNIGSAISSYSFNRPRDLMREHSQRTDELERAMNITLLHTIQSACQRHQALVHRLEALSPKGVLKRGYTIIHHRGRIVTSAKALKQGDEATIQFYNGEVTTRVEK